MGNDRQWIVLAFLVLSALIVILLFWGSARRKGFCVTVEPLAGRGKKKTVNGIPFYKKIPVFVQTSIYLDPFYEIRLFINPSDSGEKPVMLPDAVSLIRPDDLYKCKDFFNSSRSLQEKNEVITTFKKDISATYEVRGVDYFKVELKDPNLIPKLYSNVVEARMVVDWKNLYHINYRVPAIGSSSLTAELSAEGTLSKATGETTDKTIETIIGAIPTLLPVKEFLTSKWVPEKPALLPPGIIFSLEIVGKACKYTLTKLQQKAHPDYTPISLNDTEASMSLEIIDSSSTKKDNQQAAAGKAIEFSGQIKMPGEVKKED